MHIQRLFEIVYMLLDQKQTTAKALAEHFEVSTRTIYRDIDTLCEAGIPIYTTQGKGGGIYLLKEFVLDKSLLSKAEQRQILSALQGLNALEPSKKDAILSKLSGQFNQNLPNWIAIDFSDWKPGSSELFALLKDAIFAHEIISFDYFNGEGEKSSRAVYPLQLYFKDKNWYLRAFCETKRALRLFKLTRIKNATRTNRYFPPAFSLDLPEASASDYVIQEVTLTCRIHPKLAYRVYDEFDETEYHKDAEGYFIVTTTYPAGDWIFSHLLSYGAFLEVLEPLWLKEKIQTILQKTLQLYS